jgi:hypothetical protein
MKRLASRSTWWHTLPHKRLHAVKAAGRRGQPWTIVAWTSTRRKARSASVGWKREEGTVGVESGGVSPEIRSPRRAFYAAYTLLILILPR